MENQLSEAYLPEDSRSIGIGQIRISRESEHPGGSKHWSIKFLLTVEDDAYVYAWAFEEGLSSYADDPETAVRYLAENIIEQIEFLDKNEQLQELRVAPMADVEKEYHRVYQKVVEQTTTSVKDAEVGYEADFSPVIAA